MARPVTMAATQKPSTGPVSSRFRNAPLRLDDHKNREHQDEHTDADAKRRRIQRTEGVHPDGRAQSARDGRRGQLAIGHMLAGLDQHETECQDGDRVDHDNDGLRIEIEQQDRRGGEAEPEADGSDGEPGNCQHERRDSDLDWAYHVGPAISFTQRRDVSTESPVTESPDPP